MSPKVKKIIMDQVLFHFMRSRDLDRISLDLLTEVKMKLDYCATLLDQSENNLPVLQGKQEDLVVKLKVWLIEGEWLTIKVILQLIVELSLKENIYAKLFIKHELFDLIYGLMHVNFAKDEELAILCCLILHNLMARGSPPSQVAQKLQSLLLEVNKMSSTGPMLKVLAVQALGMITTYYASADVNRFISNFLADFKWNFASYPSFTLSPTDAILLLDSNSRELNHLGLWLLAHGEASRLFDWKFVSLQLKAMASTKWRSQENYYHFYHLAVSNINNVLPGIWNAIFNSNNNNSKMIQLCSCGIPSARGFEDQFIIATKISKLNFSVAIEDMLFPNKNNSSEELSNSDTVESIEER